MVIHNDKLFCGNGTYLEQYDPLNGRLLFAVHLYSANQIRQLFSLPEGVLVMGYHALLFLTNDCLFDPSVMVKPSMVTLKRNPLRMCLLQQEQRSRINCFDMIGGRVYAVTNDNEISVWEDTATGLKGYRGYFIDVLRVERRDDHKAKVRTLCHDDLNYIYTMGDDNTLRVWIVENNNLKLVNQRHVMAGRARHMVIYKETLFICFQSCGLVAIKLAGLREPICLINKVHSTRTFSRVNRELISLPEDDEQRCVLKRSPTFISELTLVALLTKNTCMLNAKNMHKFSFKKIVKELGLTSPLHLKAMAACRVDNEKAMIIIGSNCGNVFYGYIDDNEDSFVIKTNKELNKQFQRLPVNEVHLCNKSLSFLCSNGRLIYCRLDLDNINNPIRLVSNRLICPWFKGFRPYAFSSVTNVVVGFRGNFFYIVDFIRCEIMYQIDCGGSSRQWVFYTWPRGTKVTESEDEAVTVIKIADEMKEEYAMTKAAKEEEQEDEIVELPEEMWETRAKSVAEPDNAEYEEEPTQNSEITLELNPDEDVQVRVKAIVSVIKRAVEKRDEYDKTKEDAEKKKRSYSQNATDSWNQSKKSQRKRKRESTAGETKNEEKDDDAGKKKTDSARKNRKAAKRKAAKQARKAGKKAAGREKTETPKNEKTSKKAEKSKKKNNKNKSSKQSKKAEKKAAGSAKKVTEVACKRHEIPIKAKDATMLRKAEESSKKDAETINVAERADGKLEGKSKHSIEAKNDEQVAGQFEVRDGVERELKEDELSDDEEIDIREITNEYEASKVAQESEVVEAVFEEDDALKTAVEFETVYDAELYENRTVLYTAKELEELTLGSEGSDETAFAFQPCKDDEIVMKRHAEKKAKLVADWNAGISVANFDFMRKKELFSAEMAFYPVHYLVEPFHLRKVYGVRVFERRTYSFYTASVGQDNQVIISAINHTSLEWGSLTAFHTSSFPTCLDSVICNGNWVVLTGQDNGVLTAFVVRPAYNMYPHQYPGTEYKRKGSSARIVHVDIAKNQSPNARSFVCAVAYSDGRIVCVDMEIKFNGVVHCAELNKSPLGTLVCRKDEVFEKIEVEHGRYLTAMATVGNDSHRFVAVGSTSGRVAIYDIRSEATQRRTVIKYCNEAAVTGLALDLDANILRIQSVYKYGIFVVHLLDVNDTNNNPAELLFNYRTTMRFPRDMVTFKGVGTLIAGDGLEVIPDTRLLERLR
ncbi:unnamed protein product [Heligmosomoides polygyrus]|uniref:WD_REPEATS_REGION domain-containing protein n=1 Tax=Heligmosomoides polygyrus TaxID=6339 RepID=A0A3P7Z135_HELPZ|nr:unnamed protein product [Heligmosomoides polygyrus]